MCKSKKSGNNGIIKREETVQLIYKTRRKKQYIAE